MKSGVRPAIKNLQLSYLKAMRKIYGLWTKKTGIAKHAKLSISKNRHPNWPNLMPKIGFPALIGTPKRISWAEKIRADLINKVNFLKKSLVFNDDKEKETSDLTFNLFLQEWQEKTDAKWWIDNRKITVRDISDRIKKLASSFD